jgi:hypothetical protein
MFVELLYTWLAARLGLSMALGARAANRLRHDESSRRAFAWIGRLHMIGALITWVLEALVRVEERPVAGVLARLALLPIMLLWTCWVPLADGLAFGAVTAVVAVLLVRRRLARYRDELILGEPEQRARAAQACEFLGHMAEAALPELLEVSADPDPELRYRAVRAIGAVRSRDPVANEVLRRAINDNDSRVRIAAGCALAKLDVSSQSVVLPSVAGALSSEDEELQSLGVRAADSLGAQAAPLVDLLASLAGHWKLGGVAIQVLQDIGAPAVPALLRLAQNADPAVQDAARGALAHMDLAALADQTSSDKPPGSDT